MCAYIITSSNMRLYKSRYLILSLVLLSSFATAVQAIPSHPLGVVSHEYSGKINSLSIGGTLRTSDDATNACAVGLSSSATLGQAIRDPAITAITGLPAGATIVAAHLYWAGSYSPTDPLSTSLTPDYNVFLNGAAITSSKNMTDVFVYTWPAAGTNYDFFGGYADVTTLVQATGNGAYSFSGLTVNTAGNHCSVKGVLASWALHVVYSEPTEPFRVVKIYDGFEIYRDALIQITPNGFTVPAIPKGKLVVTTWEGDEGNSTTGALGTEENLKINVLPSTIPTFILSGILNPAVDPVTGLPNQFNSTINTTNPTFPTALGVLPYPYGTDIDHYDLSAQLTTGQTSLTTEYSSGSDLVILSSEIMTLENNVFADLAITKTHLGDFGVGIPNHYTLTVSNVGVAPLLDLTAVDTVTVVDTLPAGLNYVSAAGTGWTCVFAGTLSCTHPGPLLKGTSLPPITLTVTAPAVGTVTNTATVSSTLPDNITLNNTDSDLTNIITPPILTVLKSASAASAAPGSVITYTVQVNNTGAGTATAVSQDDRLSKYTALGIDCMPATAAQPAPHTITFTDGTPTSALTLGTLTFSNNGGATFGYSPPALGGGVCTFDPAVTHFRQAMTGTMPASGQYFLNYQTQVKQIKLKKS